MKTVACPNCQKKIEWSAKFPYRPFCSQHCQTIDLGAWADNQYAIPSDKSSQGSVEANDPFFDE